MEYSFGVLVFCFNFNFSFYFSGDCNRFQNIIHLQPFLSRKLILKFITLIDSQYFHLLNLNSYLMTRGSKGCMETWERWQKLVRQLWKWLLLCVIALGSALASSARNYHGSFSSPPPPQHELSSSSGVQSFGSFYSGSYHGPPLYEMSPPPPFVFFIFWIVLLRTLWDFTATSSSTSISFQVFFWIVFFGALSCASPLSKFTSTTCCMRNDFMIFNV